MFKQISVLILAATGASAVSLHDDGTKIPIPDSSATLGLLKTDKNRKDTEEEYIGSKKDFATFSPLEAIRILP